MNGDLWEVKFVDQNSPELVDRTGNRRVATTDPRRLCVYLSAELQGDFLLTVLIHELGHCAMVSYDLLDEVHRMVRPEYWIEAEEWICNFIADYGLRIFKAAYSILGRKAWIVIPKTFDRNFTQNRRRN